MKVVTKREFEVSPRRGVRLMAEAEEVVKPIIEAVATRGDEALWEYAKRFDGYEGRSFVATPDELARAARSVSSSFLDAVEVARTNIGAFARAQLPKDFMIELGPGHRVGQIVRPIKTAAAYVPGGRYPMPSTVLMTCVPALVAGVPDIWVTSPKADAHIDAVAGALGIKNVCRLGGAHAIAAFAFGTESIPRSDRIVGPGNIYVSAAKKLLAGQVGIEFVAGPTEVLIIANDGSPAWIAADILAQCEHDPDAAAYLVTTSLDLAKQVVAEIESQLANLPTASIAKQSLAENSAIILVDSDQEAVDFANETAPEHLCLHHPGLLPNIVNAGSVFLGAYTPEAAGDYVTGPNHVLPTGGAARNTGGLSVHHFLKVISVQELEPSALQSISTAGAELARAEGLEAHARSIEIRQEAR